MTTNRESREHLLWVLDLSSPGEDSVAMAEKWPILLPKEWENTVFSQFSNSLALTEFLEIPQAWGVPFVQTDAACLLPVLPELRQQSCLEIPFHCPKSCCNGCPDWFHLQFYNCVYMSLVFILIFSNVYKSSVFSWVDRHQNLCSITALSLFVCSSFSYRSSLASDESEEGFRKCFLSVQRPECTAHTRVPEAKELYSPSGQLFAQILFS